MKTELTVVDESSGEEVSCASVLKVLADETRLAVIEQLLAGPMHVGQINESLGVEQTLLVDRFTEPINNADGTAIERLTALLGLCGYDNDGKMPGVLLLP